MRNPESGHGSRSPVSEEGADFIRTIANPEVIMRFIATFTMLAFGEVLIIIFWNLIGQYPDLPLTIERR